MLNLTNVSIRNQLLLLTTALLGIMVAIGLLGILQFKIANG
jgi:hypothetical protein